MKILNLYAGIGGNRKLWNKENTGYDLEITAVEIDENIAKIYKDFFPEDNMIVGDAHQYLLEHFKEYDFIWSSPPCPSHSRIRLLVVNSGQNEPIYPDMKLYEEILFLKQFSKAKFVVENVTSYYKPLIQPSKIGRHYYWSNFSVTNIKTKGGENIVNMQGNHTHHGFDIKEHKSIDRKKTLRNLVNPEIGLHIFNCAFNTKNLFNY